VTFDQFNIPSGPVSGVHFTTRIDDRRRQKVTRNLVERISIRLDDEGSAGRDLRRR
jgi:hypothetical protein